MALAVVAGGAEAGRHTHRARADARRWRRAATAAGLAAQTRPGRAGAAPDRGRLRPQTEGRPFGVTEVLAKRSAGGTALDGQVEAVAQAGVSPGLWRNRNFLTLAGGQWVSQVGNQLFTMAVYWTVLSETGSRSDLGFVGGILSLAAVFGLVAGALVDRWDRRATMVWVDVVRVALSAALVVAAVTHHLPVVALVAVVLVMTLGSQLFFPAESALLPTVVPDGDLNAANSVNQSGVALSQMVGASLGGAILGLLGPVVLFGFNAVSFAVSVVSLMLLRLAAPPPRARTADGLWSAARALGREIAQGQQTIWRSAFLRRALPLTVLVNFALAPITFLDVAWVRQVLHLGAFVYGLFGVAILVGLLVGSAAASLVGSRLSLRTTVALAISASGLCIVGLSRVPLAVPDLLLLFGFGLFIGVVNTMIAWSTQRAIPDRVRGRVFGTLSAASNLATPVAGLLTGLGAAVLPLGTIFAAAGLLMAAMTLLMIGMPAEIGVVEVAEGA